MEGSTGSRGTEASAKMLHWEISLETEQAIQQTLVAVPRLVPVMLFQIMLALHLNLWENFLGFFRSRPQLTSIASVFLITTQHFVGSWTSQFCADSKGPFFFTRKSHFTSIPARFRSRHCLLSHLIVDLGEDVACSNSQWFDNFLNSAQAN